MEKRKKMFSLYFNEDEKKILLDASRKVGLKVSPFLRNAGIEKANKILEVQK